MTKTQRFTKKPVTIEASQWFKHGDHPEVTTIPADHPIDRNCIDPSAFGWVQTLEGGHVVSPGDWIIRGVKGEFYPCKPDIFDMTYEAEAQQPAQAAADARDAFERVKLAGAQLANIAFNLKQRVGHTVSTHDAERMEACQKEWDAALATHPQGGK